MDPGVDLDVVLDAVLDAAPDAALEVVLDVCLAADPDVALDVVPDVALRSLVATADKYREIPTCRQHLCFLLGEAYVRHTPVMMRVFCINSFIG